MLALGDDRVGGRSAMWSRCTSSRSSVPTRVRRTARCGASTSGSTQDEHGRCGSPVRLDGPVDSSGNWAAIARIK
eukprot:2294667-Prymnesium_polylepis.1